MEESTLQRQYTPVPHEGDDGLFRQSWYALCRSSDLPRGGVLGRPFLDGRVAVFRGYDGKAQVVSAYCPHIGADLKLGRVIGNSLRCAFHAWEFGRDGRCQRTGIGDPPPPTARLYTFPTQERYGMVWAFNGEAPLFDLVDPSRPWQNLLLDVAAPFEIDNDPWVVCSNTPDWAHFATVHRFDFPRDGQNESLVFEEFGVRRRFSARLEHGTGPTIEFGVTVRGTNLVLVEGVSGGKWFAVAACMGLPRPRRCEFFVATMIDQTEDPSPEAARERLKESAVIAERMGAEDSPIWNAMRFKPGMLTKADRALAQYLDQLRQFPRAHPSADFIN